MITILRNIYSALTGVLLLEQRLKSIEDHMVILNGEMGDLAKRQGEISEDLAYIRGRLDR